jgi:hypothetical protein
MLLLAARWAGEAPGGDAPSLVMMFLVFVRFIVVMIVM